jgi:two-component system, NarL family, response regulator
VSDPKIRVMVVDDHPVVRTGLRALIDGEGDMHVVAEADDGAQALSLFAQAQPEVTLLDLRLGEETGVDVVARLQAAHPGARVIMFSSYAREDEIHAALENGAFSYIRKRAPPGELLQAIRTVHAGKRYVSPEIKDRLAERIDHDDLSTREREVLQLMFEGRSNKEISTRLSISLHTVHIHVRHIMDKLGANRRTEAVANALKKGILKVD